ncbi:sodium/hydrogen exchanger 9B2-like isoform X2 [Lytechinus variegatus]|nr:sodium/hydrogen exchanger 9B2-like isoform X2 [Lytechinus variegatus]XP_041485545.1 sodium/hydrogen exchanger 9B2-like isoform X2 [Lytechinus variegatus]XP_041485546.1 sodium/hydrogen exchanger 9B2-like isoform X2 [Lytechinus variegatus]
MPETINPWSNRHPSPAQACNEDGLSPHDVLVSQQRTLEFDAVGSNPGDQLRGKESGDAKQEKSEGCPARCSSCCLQLCRPCLVDFHPLPSEPTRCQRFRYFLMCPPHGDLARWLTILLLVVLTWVVLWAVTGSEALPGGNLFALFILVVACKAGGLAIEVIKLPALLGMLIVGFMLRNIPVINVASDIHPSWSSSLRDMALVIILLQAGIGLDASALKRLSMVCVRLCCMPCIAEACTAAIVSHFLLGFPWPWGFMLGFVLGAVTPAVIVPSLLGLQARGYGVRQGIPTLVIAAASCDDVLAIGAFGVILGIAFAKGDIIYSIFRGPLELIMGVTFGCLAGLLLWYIPDQNQTWLSKKRFILLVYGGIFAVFGSGAAHYPGAGALGCLTMAFIAGHRWKEGKEAVDKLLSYLWLLFEPLLFGLIGAEVSISYLDPATVGLGFATLIIGLCVRMIVSALAVTRAGLTWKEKLFISLAWLPKATVQAAIGSVALDTARDRGNEEELEIYGIQLLTVAVLSILFTAPLGAVLISLTGPRLLRCAPPTQANPTRDIPEAEEETQPRYEPTRGGSCREEPPRENNVLLEQGAVGENSV